MSDKTIRLGNFDMLKAMYDFTATFAKTLSFREGDHFLLHQTSTKQRNWWQVVNEKGQMGFVPSNYVTTVTVSSAFLVQFLDDCIATLRNESSKSGLSSDKQELILRLAEKKRQAEMSSKSSGSVTPHFSDDSSDNSQLPKLILKPSEADIRASKSATSYSSCDAVPEPSQIGDHYTTENKTCASFNFDETNGKHSSSVSPSEQLRCPECNLTVCQNVRNKFCQCNNSSKKNSLIEIGPKPVYELVETVRKNTQLSHEMSQIALVTIVEGLQELLPSSFSPYFSAILTHVQGPLKAPEPMLNQTYDATRLKIIFTELTSCKEDSQQRSWMLHEDESIITEYIIELISILSNADANVSKHIMADDQYNAIFAMIQYYQMEVRWSIRQLLLQAFGVMCSLEAVVVNIMLNSVLPMELARDMLENPRNMQRLNYSALLLTMIFSMGEKMPITHLEHLGLDFILFLFKSIENPPDTDIDEQIPDLFLNLILAFNLQYGSNDENIVVVAAGEINEAKVFTEKILLLLNREEDPVRIFDHQPTPPHSVIKLFIDLFSNCHTAELFYTNDVKVLIDIIVRQLSDISPGDQRRQQYLELCRRVLRNTCYEDHYHRRDDILKCFTRIFCEETEESYADQQLVRKISNEFPQYFKK